MSLKYMDIFLEWMSILWSEWKMMTTEDARATFIVPTLSVVWCVSTVFSFNMKVGNL